MGDTRQYTIVLYHEAAGGYSVTCPAVPGANTQGDDLAEALDMAKECIALVLDVMAEHGEPIPDDLREVPVELNEAYGATVCRLRVPPLDKVPPVAFMELPEDVEPAIPASRLWRVLKAAGISEEEMDRLLKKIEEEDASEESCD